VALHCSGVLDEMREIGPAVPPLDGSAAERFEAARARLHEPQPFDIASAISLVADAARGQTMVAQRELGDLMGRA
jgi:beta-N-acetylhexosaminidase